MSYKAASNNDFSKGIGDIAAVQSSPGVTEQDKLLAEGLTRTLSALYSEVLALREQVESLRK